MSQISQCLGMLIKLLFTTWLRHYFTLYLRFYLRRQLAASQVMGPVVVVLVVLVVLVVFKTFTHISIKSPGRGKEARKWERQCMKGSNPEESFKREVRTYVRYVLAW